jgi:hypothetical protein
MNKNERHARTLALFTSQGWPIVVELLESIDDDAIHSMRREPNMVDAQMLNWVDVIRRRFQVLAAAVDHPNPFEER